MTRHGYLGEDDEGFERGERERDRDFMLRDRDRFGERDEERFGPEHGYGGFQGDYRGERQRGSDGGEGDYGRGRTSHPDAHYLSWRDRHMRELDRDYDEYRREREQQFHQDFSAWRLQRHGNPPPLQAGMTQTSTPGDTDGTLELSAEAASPAEGGQDPMATATMGTTSGGRGRR